MAPIEGNGSQIVSPLGEGDGAFQGLARPIRRLSSPRLRLARGRGAHPGRRCRRRGGLGFRLDVRLRWNIRLDRNVRVPLVWHPRHGRGDHGSICANAPDFHLPKLLDRVLVPGIQCEGGEELAARLFDVTLGEGIAPLVEVPLGLALGVGLHGPAFAGELRVAPGYRLQNLPFHQCLGQVSLAGQLFGLGLADLEGGSVGFLGRYHHPGAACRHETEQHSEPDQTAHPIISRQES